MYFDVKIANLYLEEGQRERAASASASTCSAPGPLSPKPVLKSSSASRAVGDIGSSATLKCTSSLRTTAEAASTTTTTTTTSATTKSSQAGSASTKSAVETESACPKTEVVETDSSGPHKEPVQISSPRPETSSVETNTEGGGGNTVITEVQTDANNAKVLLSKKTQTEITAVAVSQTDILPEDSFAEITTPSPRNKKKPLKKQRSLSKITNSFGKIV